jgi:hypothetical protein
MTDQTGSFASPGSAPQTQASTTDVARDQAANVGRSASEAGSHVAQTATEQARVVVAETTRQARDLLGEAGGQAREQAASQQQKAASQLRTVADEIAGMADKGGQSGLATEVARQAADRMHGAASWLEQREPADLMQAVRDYARRRPGTFLVGAAVAGLAVGRLTRGLTAAAQSGAETPASQPEPGPEPRRAIPPAGFAPSPAGQGDLTAPPTVPEYPTTPEYPATSVPDPAVGVSDPLGSHTVPGTGYAVPAEYPSDYGTGAEPLSRDNLGSSYEDLETQGSGYPGESDQGDAFPGERYPQSTPESYRPGQP